MKENEQSKFEGWARVEVMGHQTHIGFVRTEAYGQAVMFRVDVPQLPEREYVLREPAYVDVDGGQSWIRAGATVKREATAGYSVLIGAGSIYRILPCTEAAALKAIDGAERAPLRLISMPPEKAIAAAADESEDDYDEHDDEEEA